MTLLGYLAIPTFCSNHGQTPELSASALEERLRALWQRSYAHFASQQEATLEQLFLRRGQALRERIYPERTRRRRLYRTGLPPRSGSQLLARYSQIKEHLLTGEDFALWTNEQRFTYIRDLVALLTEIAPFAPVHTTDATWPELLRWWLAPRSPLARRPRLPEHISTWYHAVDNSFRYKLAWALGSIIALVGDDVYGDRVLEPSLENWPILGLPWIVFWLKELLVWGTLDPVAASLLAWGRADTRRNAEEEAKRYYLELGPVPIPDEMLNAASIRSWAEASATSQQHAETKGHPSTLNVQLARDFSKAPNQPWRVLPVPIDDRLYWFDPAGFLLATCSLPARWEERYLHDYDFTLYASERLVVPRDFFS